MSSKSIGKNTFYNTIKSVSSIIFPLITFPYISRVLLPDNVGKINFGISVVAYFSLIASLGITTYAIRECAKCRDDRGELSKTASEIYSLNIVTTLISYFFLGVTLLLFQDFENYRLLIIIQSLSIFFSTLGTDWINNAMEDFGYITARTLVVQLVSLVLMFAFVHEPDDYMIYAVILLVSSSGAQLFNVFYRRRYCDISFTKNIQWRKHFKPVMLLFSMQLAMIVYVNSDTTILGFMKGDTEVGLYSIPVKIYNIVQSLVTASWLGIIPQMAIGFAQKDYALLNKLLRYAFNYTLILGLPCLVGICLMAEGRVLIIAGEAYLGCVLSLRIIMLALLASFVGGFLTNLIMLPSGRDKLSFISSVISAILNLGLNFVLIPIYGLNAAAFTTFVSMLVGILIKLPFVEKKLKFDYMKKDMWSPVIGCIAMAMVIYGIDSMIEGTFIRTVSQGVSCVVVYVAILLFLRNEFMMQMVAGIKKKFMRG